MWVCFFLFGLAWASNYGPGSGASAISYGHPLLKRWFGIFPLVGDKQAPYIYPWPTTCTDPYIQPVRYCFADKRSAQNLQPIVDAAREIWAPAMAASALRIELDPRAGGDNEFPCSEMEGDKDALVIKDLSRDHDDDWNYGPICNTVTSIGYGYVIDNHNEPGAGRPYRHFMDFCDRDPDLPTGSKNDAIRSMTHELGIYR